jgi:hypothetical protein
MIEISRMIATQCPIKKSYSRINVGSLDDPLGLETMRQI